MNKTKKIKDKLKALVRHTIKPGRAVLITLKTWNIKSLLKENQSGRSMTEMLGVLAVIGILSIAALMGYNYAVTKYKANETLEELSQRATLTGLEIIQGRTKDFMSEFTPTTRLGYPASASVLEDSSYFEIQLEQVPPPVCRQIVETNWSVPRAITVNDYDYTGDSSICFQSDDKPVVMVFQFVRDLNSQDLPYGVCQTNADCSGDCVRCENNRCVSSCTGSERCAQQISTGQMLCCPKELRDGPYCCDVKNNGMCCNTHNQCCPYYKPLIDKDGLCYTCDYASQIDVTGVNDNCNVCANREVYNNKCRLKCPADKPLRSSHGECFSCDTTQLVSIIYVEHYCNICSNRMLSPNGQFCALKCGQGIYKDKPIMDTNGQCHACDEKTVWPVAAAPQNCALCPNRTLIGTMCAPKECPEGQFLGINGTCYTCQEPNPVTVSSSRELCAACPNRALGGAWNAFCMIPCGTGIYADKPVMDNGGRCYACDDETPVNLGGVSTSVCSVCDNTDTPREVSGRYCVLKNVCKDNQIKDANGKCRNCDEPDPFQTPSVSVCRGCPNRVAQGNQNAYCSLPCDEGIYEGKPLPDSRGVCHSCDEKADIYIYGVEVNCTICPNRSIKSHYCVLNE